MSVIFQVEAADCGLACLAMIANHHRKHIRLAELKQRFGSTRRGTNLALLVEQAEQLGLTARAVRIEIDVLNELQLPCILHWNLDHFVVLKSVSPRGAVLLDPAMGEYEVSMAALSQRFSGIALELSPDETFQPTKRPPRVKFFELAGRTRGLGKALAQIAFVAVLLEILAVFGPLINQFILDEVLGTGDAGLLNVLIIGYALTQLIQATITFARSWMVLLLGQSVSIQWAANVFSHLIKLPLDYFETRRLGDVASRFAAVGAIQNTLTTAVVEAVLDGVMALVGLAMMLAYSLKLTAVVLAAVFVYGLLRAAFYKPLKSASAERIEAAAREQTHFIETLRSMLPLKLFGREAERRSQWLNRVVALQNKDLATAKMTLTFSIANTLVFSLENVLVLWLGAHLVMASGLGGAAPFTIGMLFAFTAFKGQFTSRISKLIDYLVQLRMLDLHGERLADIVLHPKDEQALGQFAIGASTLDHSLELRDVWFRYGDGLPWVLEGINLRIGANESLGIVGASGAGKSTLIKILLGLIRPTSGEVYFGGVPIAELNISEFRAFIGTVMQEDCLLSGTIAENISFFDPAANQERVMDCAKLAQIHAEISAMPMGYFTSVGDLGSGLSGGQKQRILLARALYKAPRVLILDEASSSLDLNNERLIAKLLSEISVTRVIISHRPETIMRCDRVVQLIDGKVSSAESPRTSPVRNDVSTAF